MVAPLSPGGEDFASHPVPLWFRGQGAGCGEGLVRVGAVPSAQRFARHDQPDDVKGVAETRYSRPEAVEVGGRDE